MLVVAVVAFACKLPDVRRTCYIGLLGTLLCAALTLPVARLYIDQSKRVGERPVDDIASYSATPANYFASPKDNVLYGGTHARLGAQERRLFPGTLAIALAVAGLFSHRRRLMLGALIVVLLSMELSFGVNSVIYSQLLEWWPPLRGLRAPARYGIFVLAGVAFLVALGCERLARARSRLVATLLATLAIVVACVDTDHRNMICGEWTWIRQCTNFFASSRMVLSRSCPCPYAVSWPASTSTTCSGPQNTGGSC